MNPLAATSQLTALLSSILDLAIKTRRCAGLKKILTIGTRKSGLSRSTPRLILCAAIRASKRLSQKFFGIKTQHPGQLRQRRELKEILCRAKMRINNPVSPYALGSTDAEHERLIRQAARLAPLTERLFREAGIGPGQRVLDLGSGVGDVAMLVARLVGPSGEVVGVERDTRSITRAKVRLAEAGVRNVTFTQSDVSQIASTRLFDAVVGRFILMYLTDPVAVLRSLSRLVRPGGVFAFQESSWAPIFAISTHLPLWSAATSLMCEIFQRS